MDPKKETKKIEKEAVQAGDKHIKKEKEVQKKEIKRDPRQIVRVMSTDLDGAKKLKTALCSIRGINYNFSHAILSVAQMDGEAKLSELTEKDIEKIELVVKDPVKYGVPDWMVNRQFDYKTGEMKHVTGADLMVSLRNDINRLKKIRSYRGVRHEVGLTVRGQRTRTAGRTGVRIGVIRNKELREKSKGGDEKKK